MDLLSKKVLTINLNKKSYEVANFNDLHKYVGGVGLGLKLLHVHEEKDPLILSIGPLNGFFPFASKTSIVLNDEGVVEDLYMGGSLSTRMTFTGLDAIVFLGGLETPTVVSITNSSVEFNLELEQIHSLGLPGKRSTIEAAGEKVMLDKEFTSEGYILENKMKNKNMAGLVITGTEAYTPAHFSKYQEAYKTVLARSNDLTLGASNKPSCSGCPLGCEKSRYGEIGGNVLVHSLVACQFAEKVYADINTTFSCLNTLGYNYTHEDLENLPKLIEETLKAIG